MKVCSVQLITNDTPLLSSPPEFAPDSKYEWYTRIAQFFEWPIDGWQHESIQIDRTLHILPSLKLCQSSLVACNSTGIEHVILDLSSHPYLRHADWDAVNNGWSVLDNYSSVVIISHENATIEGSESLIKRYATHRDAQKTLYVLDRQGTLYDLSQSGSQRRQHRADLRQQAHRIDQKTFTRYLLRDSRRHLGHFETNTGAHVRTHYDISPLVWERTPVYDYIVTELRQICNRDNTNAVISFGIGREAIDTMRNYLQDDLKLPVFYYSEYTRDECLQKLQRGSNVVLFTDILLTGKTALSIVNEIASTSSKATGVLAVLGLSNSNKKISSSVEVEFCTMIPRPYYLPNDNVSCPLCTHSDIEATSVEVESDFEKAVQRSMTAYDFWEILLESDAFSVGHAVSTNGLNHYLAAIDTSKVLSRYGDYIAEVLSRQIVRSLGRNAFDAIVCPGEQGAAMLAYQLARRLVIGPDKVIGVRREDLEKCPPSRPNPTVVREYETLFSIRFPGVRPRVLIVDDGINTLRTVKHIVSLLGHLDVEIRGGAFFILRGEGDLLMRARRECREIFSFYRLKMAPFASGYCPVCS